MTDKFQNVLTKAVHVLIDEMMDGCMECREQGGLCKTHDIEAIDLICEPRKRIKINAKGKVTRCD